MDSPFLDNSDYETESKMALVEEYARLGLLDCLLLLHYLPLLLHHLHLDLIAHAKVIDHPQVFHPKVIDLHQDTTEFNLTDFHLYLQPSPDPHTQQRERKHSLTGGNLKPWSCQVRS